MRTTLEDWRIDERAESTADCDAAFTFDGLKDAAKRVETSFNASKAAVFDTLEEGKLSAERMLKHGRATAEDYLDDAAYRIKRNPRAAVTLAFAAGAVAGALLVLLAPRAEKLSTESQDI